MIGELPITPEAEIAQLKSERDRALAHRDQAGKDMIELRAAFDAEVEWLKVEGEALVRLVVKRGLEIERLRAALAAIEELPVGWQSSAESKAAHRMALCALKGVELIP